MEHLHMKTPNRTPGEKPERTPDAAPEGDSARDAVALLKSDHRKVEDLFKNYEAATSRPGKADLAAQICRELVAHTMLEEELFYPACREKNVEHDDLDEAQVEHDSAKILIADLMTEKPDADFFDAKVKVLSEIIKLHVGEEEEPSDGIFAKALAAGVDMDALGQQIQTRKPQLLERAEAPDFDPPRPRSLHYQRQQSQETRTMPRYSQELERDQRGRVVSDDDYRGRYRDEGDYRRGSSDRPRNEYGQFVSDDDDRGYPRNGNRRRASTNDRDRDEYGRFVSEDERSGMYSSRRYSRDDDERNGGQGWYGDPRGHSEASRRGWEHRESGRYDYDDDRRQSRGGRYDEENDRQYSRGGRYEDDDGRGHGGWFGDSRGHAEAARRGWEHRESGRYASHDDDRRPSSRSRYEDDDRGHGGWFGDPEGHAEASRRGWRNR
jgi:hypothetical protein